MAETSKVVRLHSVEHAAINGTRRDLLVALREVLWQALSDKRTQPRDLSPISLRLKELQAEIETIDARDLIEEQSKPRSRGRRFDAGQL